MTDHFDRLVEWTKELEGNTNAILYRSELVTEELLRAIKHLQTQPNSDHKKAIVNESLVQLVTLAEMLGCNGLFLDRSHGNNE